MTFEDLLKTTNKGLPASVGENSHLSSGYYRLSLGLEILFLLLFVGYFGLSLFRSMKKIKNPKFKTDSKEEESSIEEDEDSNEEEDEKNTNDQLVYRFDEEDHEKENKDPSNEDDFLEEKEKEPEEEEKEVDEEYDNEHDENEEKFLEIDHKFNFLQPFLIGHILCNNLFACDLVSICMLIATVGLFMVFNVKGVCSQARWTNILFMVPGMLSFIPVFINDHDMST